MRFPIHSSERRTIRTRGLLALPILAASCAVASIHAFPMEALGEDKLYRYRDSGVTVLSNIAPSDDRKLFDSKVTKEGVTRIILRPGVTRDTKKLLRKKMPDEYLTHLKEACALHQIPVPLAAAVMAVESNFNPTAVSPVGALGLMQLMPDTAEEMEVPDAFAPRDNIFGGVKYLRKMLNRFEGDEKLALAAYNAGPTAVEKAEGIPNFAETKDYVEKVTALAEAYGKLPRYSANAGSSAADGQTGEAPPPTKILGYEPQSAPSREK